MQHYLRYKLSVALSNPSGNLKRLKCFRRLVRELRFYLMLRNWGAIAVWRRDRTQANTR